MRCNRDLDELGAAFCSRMTAFDGPEPIYCCSRTGGLDETLLSLLPSICTSFEPSDPLVNGGSFTDADTALVFSATRLGACAGPGPRSF